MPWLNVLLMGENAVGIKSLIYCYATAKSLDASFGKPQKDFDVDSIHLLGSKITVVSQENNSNVITIGDCNFNLQLINSKDLSLSYLTPYSREPLDDLDSYALFAIADVMVVVFSINDYRSFQCVEESVKKAKRRGLSQVPILLVGNKADLRNAEDHYSNLSIAEGDMLAREINATKYLECSCKTGMGVRNVFYEAVWATMSPTSKDKFDDFETDI